MSRECHLNHETEQRLTLESHKTVVKVLVMVAAVTALLFVRSDSGHQNVAAAEMTSLFENTYLEGCFVSREWSEALARLGIFQDRTAGRAHLGRGIQTLKRSAEKLHEIYPSLSAEEVVSRVTSVHNKLDRINQGLQSVSMDVCTLLLCLENRGQ